LEGRARGSGSRDWESRSFTRSFSNPRARLALFTSSPEVGKERRLKLGTALRERRVEIDDDTQRFLQAGMAAVGPDLLHPRDVGVR
jgi:hypothetical protein